MTTDWESERALLARIQAGDKAACAECIEQHSAGVYRLALRLRRVQPILAPVDEPIQPSWAGCGPRGKAN